MEFPSATEISMSRTIIDTSYLPSESKTLAEKLSKIKIS